MFEVRVDGDPVDAPLGTATLSRHATLAEAFVAVAHERRQLCGVVIPGQRRPYPARVVVEIDADGNERVLAAPNRGGLAAAY